MYGQYRLHEFKRREQSVLETVAYVCIYVSGNEYMQQPQN